MVKNHCVQQQVGATDIVLLEPNELNQQFPWINTDDILLGSYGAKGEGWFDPWALVCGFRRQNLAMGVQYIHGEPVASRCDGSTGKVLSVDLRTFGASASLSSSIHTVRPQFVVNAAGAAVIADYNIPCPSNPANAASISFTVPILCRCCRSRLTH